MEEGAINKVAKDILGRETTERIEPTYKVEPITSTEHQKSDGSTENPNETPKNIHPYLGHNIDIKA